MGAVTRSLSEDVSAGTYMVVDANLHHLWKDVMRSPLGAVEKKGVDPKIEARLIYDLSFPNGSSTNSASDKLSVPSVSYESVTRLALRIEQLAASCTDCDIKMMKGDMKGVFRHLVMHALHVHRMTALIPELNALVVDLAAPLGCSRSPPYYSASGRAISWLAARNSPTTVSDSLDNEQFFEYEWVGDYVMIEVVRGNRLKLVNATLRHAMMAILGPRLGNEAKFSPWPHELSALGLIWNTRQRTVSIPSDKIEKARRRADGTVKVGSVTKKDIEQLLGSQRYIAICLRATKPFFQQFQYWCTHVPRFGRTQLSSSVRNNIQRFIHILQHERHQALPLNMFGSLPSADVHLYMDASNSGLAV